MRQCKEMTVESAMLYKKKDIVKHSNALLGPGQIRRLITGPLRVTYHLPCDLQKLVG